MASGPMLALAPDTYTGKMLGKYEVLCRLSTGGMSVIFLASQRGLAGFKKLVVLKQILPDIKGDEAFVRMFLEEAKITAAFTHPNIAHVYDLDVSNGELFLAMEFIEGVTMVEILDACREAGEPLPLGFVLPVIRDTALALHYAHTFTDPAGRVQSVIHRDVAEKNIMVTYEGAVKLLDFGIAKQVGRMGHTEVGTLKGTSGYMSPEQILGQKLDGRSDVFALGVVFHQCLTGVRLFYGKNPSEEMNAALHETVYPPSRTNPEVTPELDAVILKALERNRNHRYESALELAHAIEQVAGSHVFSLDRRSAFLIRHFESRRAQTRNFIHELQAGETTGELHLSGIMNPARLLAPPRAEMDATLPPNTVSLDLQDDLTHQVLMPYDDSPEMKTIPATPMMLEEMGVALKAPAPSRSVEGRATTPLYTSRIRVPSRAAYIFLRSRLRMVVAGVAAMTLGALLALGFMELQEDRSPPVQAPEPPPGLLTLVTRPPSRVMLDSRDLGNTPLSKVSFPSGKYTFRLVGPDKKVRILPVEVKTGATTVVRVTLDSLAVEP